MKRALISVLVILVLTPAAWAKDDMNAKVKSMGASMGAAVGKERRTANGGRVRDFEKGAIYWSQKTGAHFVANGALEEFRTLGGEGGTLGFPVSDARMIDGNLVQTFEHGFLTTTRTGEVQTTLLPGVSLTESSLTVLTPTAVNLPQLELDPIGFLIFRAQDKVQTTLKCSCLKNADAGSQRLGFCKVIFSDGGKTAECEDTDCENGSCIFSLVADN